ncbi:NADH-quinone oxidoreductase subunit J family protein [Rhabdothermincola salaria]|uniref:NADH-quinone oxidoreductase subunit J family protein n=1 Tax=Rhabdothermincola salaria TaxID=2903142 RepID=UPI001E481105|nr:NADH-quinone oxidoreductase subunit J [Rhabdothermincola salaria]MCD9625728.1 NADH-quinone oxidoreductase subunit J [Rhabdothermincola salaria]
MLALLVAQNIAFYVIAALMVFGAIRVVTSKNIMHAALWLVLVLAGVAAQYILLAAEFVAITQVLVYLGAIMVLFLFGIMLTRSKIGRTDDLDNPGPAKAVAAGIGVILAGLLGFALWDGFEDREFGDIAVQRTAEVSDSIFSTFLIPFWVISVLLLVALVGAIVLARRD